VTLLGTLGQVAGGVAGAGTGNTEAITEGSKLGETGAVGTPAAVKTTANTVANVANTAAKVAKAGASASEFLTSGSTWKGIGLCIAGGLLVLLGLLQLTGRDVSSVVQAARP